MPDPRYIIAAYDYLGPKHAGPAIRTLALARQLSKIGDVDIIFEGEAPSDQPARISFIEKGSVDLSAGFFLKYKAALVPPLVAMTVPQILESDIPVVVDLFDPVVWENLLLYKSEPEKDRQFQHERHLAALIAALFRGDYFIVAGKRQQDLFLGSLMALNRVNPSTWIEKSGPGQLVGLVPFGLPDGQPPDPDETAIPDIYSAGGNIAVWGGGMWDWLCPETVVKAWPMVLKRYPDAILAFPGTDHPNPHVPEMASVGRVRKLSRELGIEKNVVFGSWLPRDEYLALLGRASVGVSAHSPGLEATYAVRTRFLDSIWMGLPMVVSGDDEYSSIIAEQELGVVIESESPTDFANGIIHVMDQGRGAYAGMFARARSELTWSKAAAELVEWMVEPRITHGSGIQFFRDTVGDVAPRERPSDLGSLVNRVIKKLRN